MKQLGPALAILLCSGILANAQTLADHAREERAKKQASSTIVINNSTIKETTGTVHTADPAALPAAPAAAQPAAPAAQHDEKWWHEQFERVRAEIKRLDTQISLLESSVKEANRDFLTRAYDPSGAGQRNITEANAKLEAAKAARAQEEKKLAQLQDDLRRSGQPAGWAR
jgi:hypothetical protein